MRKRLFSIILCIISFVLNFSGIVYAEGVTESSEKSKRVAEVRLDSEETLINVKSVSNFEMTRQMVDGRLAYVQNDPSDGYPGLYARFRVDIDDDYWYSEEPQVVKVTLEYKDVENDSISIHYNSPVGGNWTFVDVLVTEGTNEWKTYELYLDDFMPCNDIYGDKADLVVYAAGWNYDAPGKSVIGSVKIEENIYEHNVLSTPTNGYVARMFDYEKSDVMTVEYVNTSEKKYSAKAEYSIYDNENRLVSQGSVPEIEVPAGERKETTFNTEVYDCGTYVMKLKTTILDNGVEVDSYSKDYNFSVVRTLQKGDERADAAAVVVHLIHDTPDNDQILEVIDRVGFGSVRAEMSWAQMEVNKGEYVVDDYFEERLKSLKKSGIEHMALLGKASSLYNGGQGDNVFVDSEEAINAYAKATAYIASREDYQPKYIEILNEWNITGFNALGLGWDVYLKYCKAAYEAIKAVNPEIEVVAVCTAGFDVVSIEKFMQLGGLEYCDAISHHPYQGGGGLDIVKFQSQCDTIKDLMRKYGGEEKPIYLSEIGWPNALEDIDSIPETDRRNSWPKYYLYGYSHENVSKYYWYCMIDGGSSPYGREANWGLVNYGVGDNALTAQDTFVTYAAAMNLIQNATPNKQIENSSNTYAHDYIKKDGKHIAGIWTTDASSRIALDLGTKEIQTYDMYGSKKSLLKSDSGIFSFDLCENVIYIEGDFTKFEEVMPEISLSSGKIDALNNDEFTLTIDDVKGRNLKIALDYDEEIFKAKSPLEVIGGKASLKISTDESAGGIYHIGVKLYDDFGTYYDSEIVVNVSKEKLKFSYTPVQITESNDKRWRLNVDITNLSNISSIEGDCYVSEPANFVSDLRHFTNIYPGETRRITLNIPEIILKRPELLGVEVKLNDGEIYSLTEPLDFTTAIYADEKPEIDGEMSPGEWDDALLLAENRKEKFYSFDGVPWSGEEDCSVQQRIKWDEENLYMYIEVKDNAHNQPFTDYNMWHGDSIQFGIYQTSFGIEETTSSFTEIGLGLTPDGTCVYRYSSCMGKPSARLENAPLAVISEKGITKYELAIPWSELFDLGHTVKKGDAYRFSLLVNDSDDGDDRHGWLNYNDGIGLEKNSKLFGRLILK